MLRRLISAFTLPVLAGSATIPAATALHVRLLTQASSEKPSGDAVRAVLVAPVLSGESIDLPSGVVLTGKTADAQPAQTATTSTTESPAHLRLIFDHLSDASGHSQTISCRVMEIDNARETIDNAGLITGITPSETYEARIDQGISKLSTRNQELATLLGGLRSSMVKDVDPSITFPPGVDLTVELTAPLTWTGSVTDSKIPAPFPGAGELAALIASEPPRTVAQNPPKPSDLTNLMFLGTEEQVTQAFQQAGWSTAAQLGADSKMKTAQAIIEDRGYSQAPVSILMLDGRPPDLTFQKQTDTFSKRHHIRIWRRPGAFRGAPIWVAAATHDTGIDFSRESKTFTHAIDSNIDLERAKVVNDLVFTGMVHALALVPRTNLPPDLSNATGDRLNTDGKIAVLAF